MSRLKKFVAGALAVVLCATSIAAKAPAQAEAAAYCCHTIYHAGTSTTTDSKECARVQIGYVSNRQGTFQTPVYNTCYLKTITKYNNYACYKCNYTYKSVISVTQTHSLSH